jgi:hypothetical protein
VKLCAASFWRRSLEENKKNKNEWKDKVNKIVREKEKTNLFPPTSLVSLTVGCTWASSIWRHSTLV